MGVCENIAPFAVNDHTGAQAGALEFLLPSGIEKILEKRIKKRVQSEGGKRVLPPHLVLGTDIDHRRADFLNSYYHRRFTGIKAQGGVGKKEHQNQSGKKCRRD